jgi:hypothetical protein
MVNSRGWFRVFEATIACLILLGVFLFIFEPFTGDDGFEEGIEDLLRKSLENIELNESLRSAIIIEDSPVIDSYLQSVIWPFLNYSFVICDLEIDCAGVSSEKEVFVMSRVFSSSKTAYDPKQLKLEVWGK